MVDLKYIKKIPSLKKGLFSLFNYCRQLFFEDRSLLELHSRYSDQP